MTPYYSEDGIVIYHGDCREILPEVSADVLITDPPYGIGHASNRTCPTTTAAWMNRAIRGDYDTSARDEVVARFPEWCVFGSHKATPPKGARDVLIWDKGPASGMGDLSWPWKRSWELVFLAGSGWRGHRDEGVLKGFHVVTRASMGRVHPNEKPVFLMRHFVAKHQGVVLDAFMGSGTTLVAAQQERRSAIGIEIEERYCEIAAKRLSQGVLALEATA